MAMHRSAAYLAFAVLAATGVPVRAQRPAAPSEAACPATPAGDTVLAGLREAQLAGDHGASMQAVMAKLGPTFPAAARELKERDARDWAFLCRYRAENRKLVASRASRRAVFLGDSITENWISADPSFFGAEVLDRGVSGQTSGQILLRFYQDVARLAPRIVHLNAGTNDLGNAVTTDDDIVNNLSAMIDMAQVNGIRVVLSAILPSTGSTLFRKQGQPMRIRAINARLRQLARERRVAFVDYAAVLGDAEGGIRAEFTNDGVHPNRAGYAVMRPLAERAMIRADGAGRR